MTFFDFDIRLVPWTFTVTVKRPAVIRYYRIVSPDTDGVMGYTTDPEDVAAEEPTFICQRCPKKEYEQAIRDM